MQLPEHGASQPIFTWWTKMPHDAGLHCQIILGTSPLVLHLWSHVCHLLGPGASLREVFVNVAIGLRAPCIVWPVKPCILSTFVHHVEFGAAGSHFGSSSVLFPTFSTLQKLSDTCKVWVQSVTNVLRKVIFEPYIGIMVGKQTVAGDMIFNARGLSYLYSFSGLTQALGLLYNSTGDVPCFNINADINNATAVADDLWNWQSCTEMVIPFSFDGGTSSNWLSAWFIFEALSSWMVQTLPF